jgi:alpha-tubulin suppressor-like RCC1 family protein
MVSAEGNHTAAIKSDGTLYTWGANGSGQLGDGTTTSRSSPVLIGAFFDDWDWISTGPLNTVGIKTGGTLFTWGINGGGQLGDSTILSKSSPVQIGYGTWSQVVIARGGGSHVAAITTTGALFTWGFNNAGQLGSSTITSRSSPVVVGTSSWTAVSAGSSHTVAIRLGGGLFIWGGGTNGEMGNSLRANRSSPVQLGSISYVAVAAGAAYTIARSATQIYAWGFNGNGRLGDGTTTSRSSPVVLNFLSIDWGQISAGQATVLTAPLGNNLYAWGFNTQGQVGDSTAIARSSSVLIGYTANKSSPIQIGASSWSAVSAGSAFTIGITSVNALFAWGSGTSGRLGNNATTSRSSPVQIGTSSWTAITAGTATAAAIDANSRLFTWGFGTSGQLGDDTTTTKSSPVLVGSGSWIAVSMGQLFANAIKSDSILYSWGTNTSGELGNDTQISGRSGPNLAAYPLIRKSPIQIGTSSWVSVSSGLDHSAAINYNNLLFVWGVNTVGQLGDGTNTNRSSPVQIGTSSWSAVSAGSSYTTALTK